MAESEAILGYGTLFQTESLDSPGDWVTVAEVVEVKLPKPARDAIDTTHEHKPGEWVEPIAGMKRGGEASIKFNFVPGAATYDDLAAELNDQVVRSRRIVFPNGAILPFDAFLKGLEPEAPIEGGIMATATFQVSGAVGPIT